MGSRALPWSLLVMWPGTTGLSFLSLSSPPFESRVMLHDPTTFRCCFESEIN